MARRSKQVVQRGADDTYLGLVRALPLRPIRSEAELDRAIAMIDSLLTRDDLEMGEEDYVDVLSDLVHKYEAEHDPIAPVTDADLVRFLLESNDMAQADDSRLIMKLLENPPAPNAKLRKAARVMPDR
jgi:HTH-type transcriptional regulator/antitoxin HigA